VEHSRIASPALVEKPVYDIVNAGPRQRFVVRGKEGPFIVHNCVQALARIIVGEQMLATQTYLRTLKLTKTEVARVVLMTHDEIVSCVPAKYADKVLSAQLGIMRQSPHNWGATIPLDADGGWAANYSK
jgi:hypothetical protein